MVTSAAAIEAQNAATIAATRAGQATGASTASQSLMSNMNTFLTLLTQQLQHQDPLNPMDTADFTNQLVLYTQAEQQIKTNDSLSTLISLNRGTIGTQALGYIGKDIGYIGDVLNVEDSAVAKDQTFTYSMAGDAAVLKVNILDEDGTVVRNIELEEGDMVAGDHEITWDGKDNNGNPVEKGNYSVSIAALDKNNAKITTQTLVYGRVTGIASDGSGSVNLTLNGKITVPLNSIFSVSQPATPATSTATAS